MTDLKIPEAALAAADQVTTGDEHRMIEAALPLAFAAELRGLLREMEEKRLEMRREDDLARRSSGLSEGIRLLRNRIAELDPEGLTA